MKDNEPIITMRDLASRLDRIEAKLTEPEKPDMNKILRAAIDDKRNSETVQIKSMFQAKKGK